MHRPGVSGLGSWLGSWLLAPPVVAFGECEAREEVVALVAAAQGEERRGGA